MPESGRQKLLLLGDSLTQLCFESSEGWGRDLANRYQRRADVLNRGMSGYNTRWYLRYAQDSGIWNEPGKVALVTFWFGANDAATLDQHVPLPEYQSNLGAMIDNAKESYPNAKILVLTPPPVALQQRSDYLKKQFGAEKAKEMAERSSKVTGSYADAIVKLCYNKKIALLDVFRAMITACKNETADYPEGIELDEIDVSRFFWDGLHFSDTGHKFVSEALTKAIHLYFPALEVRPCSITGQFNNSSSECENLKTNGPYHDVIKSKRTWQEAFD